jgi:hypothetical protein
MSSTTDDIFVEVMVFLLKECTGISIHSVRLYSTTDDICVEGVCFYPLLMMISCRGRVSLSTNNHDSVQRKRISI